MWFSRHISSELKFSQQIPNNKLQRKAAVTMETSTQCSEMRHSAFRFPEIMCQPINDGMREMYPMVVL